MNMHHGTKTINKNNGIISNKHHNVNMLYIMVAGGYQELDKTTAAAAAANIYGQGHSCHFLKRVSGQTHLSSQTKGKLLDRGYM